MYRRIRSAEAYLEMVDVALRDSSTNAQILRSTLDVVLGAIPRLSGTDEEKREALTQLNAVSAQALEAGYGNPASHLEAVCARASNTCAGTLELLAEAREFLYVRGAPDPVVPKVLKDARISQLLGAGEHRPVPRRPRRCGLGHPSRARPQQRRLQQACKPSSLGMVQHTHTISFGRAWLVASVAYARLLWATTCAFLCNIQVRIAADMATPLALQIAHHAMKSSRHEEPSRQGQRKRRIFRGPRNFRLDSERAPTPTLRQLARLPQDRGHRNASTELFNLEATFRFSLRSPPSENAARRCMAARMRIELARGGGVNIPAEFARTQLRRAGFRTVISHGIHGREMESGKLAAVAPCGGAHRRRWEEAAGGAGGGQQSCAATARALGARARRAG